MREFLLGVVIAAVVTLWVGFHDMKSHIDALQLQINLVTSQIDREASCKTWVPVLVPGEDFYHPNVTSLCGQK